MSDLSCEIELLKKRIHVLDTAVQHTIAIFAQTATPDQLYQLSEFIIERNIAEDNLLAEFEGMKDE